MGTLYSRKNWRFYTMKKLLCVFLAALLTLCLAACGGNEPSGQPAVESSLELLATVWGSYSDDEKFPAAGGDMSEDNMTMGEPGKFSTDDAAALDTTLGLPEASAGKIDEAASLVHMMNANTFTCGAFHLKDSKDAASVAAALKDNLMQRQWMCGFPDKLVIVQLDGYVVSFFGENEIVGAFLDKLTKAYPAAETVCDEPLA